MVRNYGKMPKIQYDNKEMQHSLQLKTRSGQLISGGLTKNPKITKRGLGGDYL